MHRQAAPAPILGPTKACLGGFRSSERPRQRRRTVPHQPRRGRHGGTFSGSKAAGPAGAAAAVRVPADATVDGGGPSPVGVAEPRITPAQGEDAPVLQPERHHPVLHAGHFRDPAVHESQAVPIPRPADAAALLRRPGLSRVHLPRRGIAHRQQGAVDAQDGLRAAGLLGEDGRWEPDRDAERADGGPKEHRPAVTEQDRRTKRNP